MNKQVKVVSQEQQARDIAYCIADTDETDITHQDINDMAEGEVYEWIEAWGYYWDEVDQEWIYDNESEADNEEDEE